MVINIILAVIVAVVVIGISSMLYVKRILQKRDMDYGSDKEIYGKGRKKKALLIHQPSLHGSSLRIAQAAARQLEALGYEVTLDYPSRRISYQPQGYDILSFSGATYLGHVGKPLLDYLKAQSFFHKKVIVFTVGTVRKDQSDLEELTAAVPEENLVCSIKLSSKEEIAMMDFVKHCLK